MSSEIQGAPADVGAIRDDAVADGSGVAHAAPLLAWCDATIAGDPGAIASARARVVEQMGDAAAVDAAAVMANFERMTRIADATGIPLDPPVNAMSSELQRSLGLRAFRSAANTAGAGLVARAAARLFAPLLSRLMPSMAERVKTKMRAAQ